jgi:hypothetical protein
MVASGGRCAFFLPGRFLAARLGCFAGGVAFERYQSAQAAVFLLLKQRSH